MDNTEGLWALLLPVAVEEHVELVDVEVMAENGSKILRVYIDRPEGIVVADCARFSHAIEDLLEVNVAVSGRYHLEVSSPGIERPLRKREHFEKVLGQTVSVVTREKIDGRGKYKGILKSVNQGELVISIDGRDFRVPLSQVFKARLEVRIGRSES